MDIWNGLPIDVDGSVVLAGETRGSWNATSAGDLDWAAMKLDAEGTVVWKWQVRQEHPRHRELLALCMDTFAYLFKIRHSLGEVRPPTTANLF